MKIVFTKEEVEQIVLAHVQRMYTPDLNEINISGYSSYSSEYCVVSRKDPDPDPTQNS